MGSPNRDPWPRIRASIFHRLKRKSRRDASGEAILFSSCSFLKKDRLASVGPIAGGTIALAVASALAASVVLAAEPEPKAVFVAAPRANTAG